MAVIKCKMCGGDMEISPEKSFGTCEYCGSTMTLPKVSDEQRAAAFNRGNHFRRMGEFDKALGVYERIVAEDDTDAEAHWCCALCRFGIEYVEDPASYEWLPTCHRASFDSFLEDVDYLAALEHSDGITRRQYQKDAAKIAEVQRGILATSQNTEPYDVFISYKELDANGERTKDSILAQDIYYQLVEQGRRVFFSRITLEDIPGTQYEPYIFAALNSAKVMIVVGTSPENLNAVWVKNEWSRFLAMMRKDKGKLLIPCYRDMDAYDLPEQLAVLMSYDMGRIGFIQDLIRGVSKVLDAEKQKEATQKKETVVIQQSGGPNVQAMLDRGNMALEDKKWEDAQGFFNRALDMDAKCGEAYLGLFLVEHKASSVDAFVAGQLGQLRTCLDRSLTACDQQEERIRKAIQDKVVPFYLGEEELKPLFVYDRSYQSSLSMREEQLQMKERFFSENRTLSRAKQYATPELMEKLKGMEDAVLGFLKDAIAKARAENEITAARITAEYAAHLEKAEAEAERLSQEARARKEADYVEIQAKREADYVAACQAADAASSMMEHGKVAKRFAALKDYKDSAERQKIESKKMSAILLHQRQIAAEELKRQRTMAEEWQRSKEEWQRSKAEERKKQSVLKRMFTKEKEEVYQSYQPDMAGSAAVWEKTGNWHALVAGGYHTVGLKADGTVVTVGDNDSKQCNVNDWQNIVALSAGNAHTIGLKADGTVVATGVNHSKQCNVNDWQDIVAVSAGNAHTVGLKADGTVVAMGINNFGQCNVSDWTDIIAVSAGGKHTVGLKADGTVEVVGDNYYGQCNVDGWTDIVAVSAGDVHTVGLKADGTVVAVGSVGHGRCEVRSWQDIVAVSAGDVHTVGLKADGTVVAVGGNLYGQSNVNYWKDIVAVSAGASHTVALKENGAVLAVGKNDNGQCNVSYWKDIKLPEV
ncbi:MAG: TIR domain-containing protein [Faecousia sp.]